MPTTYTLPTHLDTDAAANLAAFLLKNTGSIFGKWAGKMAAKDQRALFGRNLGRGNVVIDGTTETVKMVVSVCFGTDFDVRELVRWVEFSEVA